MFFHQLCVLFSTGMSAYERMFGLHDPQLLLCACMLFKCGITNLGSASFSMCANKINYEKLFKKLFFHSSKDNSNTTTHVLQASKGNKLNSRLFQLSLYCMGF